MFNLALTHVCSTRLLVYARHGTTVSGHRPPELKIRRGVLSLRIIMKSYQRWYNALYLRDRYDK